MNDQEKKILRNGILIGVGSLLLVGSLVWGIIGIVIVADLTEIVNAKPGNYELAPASAAVPPVVVPQQMASAAAPASSPALPSTIVLTRDQAVKMAQTFPYNQFFGGPEPKRESVIRPRCQTLSEQYRGTCLGIMEALFVAPPPA